MRVGRRCFVSNLAWRTSWQDLKDAFRDCGTVVYSNVIRDPAGALPPRAVPRPRRHGPPPAATRISPPGPTPARRPFKGMGHRGV
jgi:hypothetical protein